MRLKGLNYDAADILNILFKQEILNVRIVFKNTFCQPGIVCKRTPSLFCQPQIYKSL